MNVSLSAQNVVKRYGGVVALADGNLDVHSREVVALIGANGSGKSTLSKIITGVAAPDQGQLLLDGQPVRFPSPQAAKNLGITAVYQELSLVPQMTVAENIWLAHEPLRRNGSVDTKEVKQRTEELLSLFAGTVRAHLEPDIPVSFLSADEKQIVEILKAFSLNPRVLILDEATASLDGQQVRRLFELVNRWKAEDMSIVFVSHRMDEIFKIADRVTVLRNGRTVGSANIDEITEREIVEWMIEDRAISSAIHRERQSPASLQNREVVLCVENLATETLKGIGLQVRRGELLGLGGLQGQGQRALLHSIFGAAEFSGKIELFGRPAHFSHPKQAMKNGIALVPGERAKEGLLLSRSILENFHLPSWSRYGFPLRMRRARAEAENMGKELGLVMSGLDAPVNSLSGGNAQKVVIGKWLLRDPKLLLLDDPTKGVDVGTKGEFYNLLSRLCEQGTSILFYSSDDEELLGLCDRVIVLHDGLISGELAGDRLTRSNLVAMSMGATNGSTA